MLYYTAVTSKSKKSAMASLNDSVLYDTSYGMNICVVCPLESFPLVSSDFPVVNEHWIHLIKSSILDDFMNDRCGAGANELF